MDSQSLNSLLNEIFQRKRTVPEVRHLRHDEEHASLDPVRVCVSDSGSLRNLVSLEEGDSVDVIDELVRIFLKNIVQAVAIELVKLLSHVEREANLAAIGKALPFRHLFLVSLADAGKLPFRDSGNLKELFWRILDSLENFLPKHRRQSFRHDLADTWKETILKKFFYADGSLRNRNLDIRRFEFDAPFRVVYIRAHGRNLFSSLHVRGVTDDRDKRFVFADKDLENGISVFVIMERDCLDDTFQRFFYANNGFTQHPSSPLFSRLASRPAIDSSKDFYHPLFRRDAMKPCIRINGGQRRETHVFHECCHRRPFIPVDGHLRAPRRLTLVVFLVCFQAL